MSRPTKTFDLKTLKKAANHKFITGKYSFFDEAWEPIYNAVAKFVPQWIHPNYISIFGAVVLQLSLILVMQQPTSDYPPQYGIGFVTGNLILLYQILDAVDGKHARLTNQTSSLGAMVDHGLDVFATPVVSLVAMKFVAPQLDFRAFVVFVAFPQITHFMFLLREHVNGKFDWNIGGGLGGATEFLTLVVVVCLLSDLNPKLLILPLNKKFFPWSVYDVATFYMTTVAILMILPAMVSLVTSQPQLLGRERKDASRASFHMLVVLLLEAIAFYSMGSNEESRHFSLFPYLLMLPFVAQMFKLLVSSAVGSTVEGIMWDHAPAFLAYFLMLGISLTTGSANMISWCGSFAFCWMACRHGYLMCKTYFAIWKAETKRE